MKDGRVKQVFSRSGYQWGRGQHQERGVRANAVDVFTSENTRMKPVGSALRKGQEEGKHEGVSPRYIVSTYANPKKCPSYHYYMLTIKNCILKIYSWWSVAQE
jgi:hypothetical protein